MHGWDTLRSTISYAYPQSCMIRGVRICDPAGMAYHSAAADDYEQDFDSNLDNYNYTNYEEYLDAQRTDEDLHVRCILP